MRYAKWKASEIARAIREGRKPAPGAVDENLREEVGDGSPKSAPSTMDSLSIKTPSDLPVDIPPVISIDSSNIPQTPPRKSKPVNPTIDVPSPDVSSPGMWSTVATPGSDISGLPSAPTNLVFASAMNRLRSGDDESPLKARGGLGPNLQPDISSKKVHFSPSVVGGLSTTDGSAPVSPEAGTRTFSSRTAVPPPPLDIPPVVKSEPRSVLPSAPSGSGRSKIEPSEAPLPDSPPFASSPTKRNGDGGSPPSVGNSRASGSPTDARGSRLGSSPPGAGGAKLSSSPPRALQYPVKPSDPPSAPALSTPSAPPVPPASGEPDNLARGHERRTSLTSRNSPPQPPIIASYPTPPPPMPPTTASFSSTSTYVSAPVPSSYPSKSTPYVDGSAAFGSVPKPSNAPSAAYNPYGAASVPAPPPPTPPFELTPAIIAKAQKHCRYAISSLEYEDVEQARKELRAALKVLGES